MATPTGAKARPKQYVRPVPTLWWTKRPSYVWFMLRELSAGALAGYAVFLLMLMAKVKDPAALDEAIAGLQSPVSIALHLVVLAFTLLNTITTFNLTPKMLVIQNGEERVPDSVITRVHYVAWAVISMVLFALIMKA